MQASEREWGEKKKKRSSKVREKTKVVSVSGASAIFKSPLPASAILEYMYIFL